MSNSGETALGLGDSVFGPLVVAVLEMRVVSTMVELCYESLSKVTSMTLEMSS